MIPRTDCKLFSLQVIMTDNHLTPDEVSIGRRSSFFLAPKAIPPILPY